MNRHILHPRAYVAHGMHGDLSFPALSNKGLIAILQRATILLLPMNWQIMIDVAMSRHGFLAFKDIVEQKYP